LFVKFRKVVQRSIREVRDGVSIAADVNVTVAGNVDEHGGTTKATSGPRTGGDDDERGTDSPRDDERSPNG
jgi:hypothetical protein